MVHRRNSEPSVTSGLRNLRVLKTTKSSFTNFVNDSYRSLPDADDRIFSTVVESEWGYGTHTGISFDRVFYTVMVNLYRQSNYG